MPRDIHGVTDEPIGLDLDVVAEKTSEGEDFS